MCAVCCSLTRPSHFAFQPGVSLGRWAVYSFIHSCWSTSRLLLLSVGVQHVGLARGLCPVSTHFTSIKNQNCWHVSCPVVGTDPRTASPYSQVQGFNQPAGCVQCACYQLAWYRQRGCVTCCLCFHNNCRLDFEDMCVFNAVLCTFRRHQRCVFQVVMMEAGQLLSCLE
jgi:hypothetical protein